MRILSWHASVRLAVLFAFAALIAAATWGAWKMRTAPETPPPPASGESGARFVGSEKCGECHQEQFRQHAESGHARTFWNTDRYPAREQFEGLQFEDGRRRTTFHYSLDESGAAVAVDGLFPGERFPLQFAFGSGEHAVTFVTLTPDGSGIPTGIEHRVSWFSGLKRADLTPGHIGLPVHQDVEHFGRILRGEVLSRCFECHTTSGTIAGDRLADLIPNVGCESCHGGGAAHAAAMQENPLQSQPGFDERPWRTREQIQICADCHRGVDNVSQSKIRRDEPTIVRYQPVGLVQSRCYLNSKRLVCSTCHNPHEHAARRSTEEYEQQCLQCHSSGTHTTQCSISPDSGCISCHMPRIEIHPSISFHDHWIRVRDESDPPAVESQRE